jgi:copper chaperone CopZ
MQFLVDDMMCNGCEDTIQHELRHTEGVSHVSANHIEGTVEVTGNAELSTLVEQVNELGFTANVG